MKTTNTKAIVEGAIFAALTALIGIIAYYIPVLTIFALFWAVPTIIIGYRNGLGVSAAATIIGAILVSIFTSPIVGLKLFITYGIPGIAMGYMFNKKYSPIVIILASGIVFGVCNGVGYILEFMLSGVNIIEGMNKIFNEARTAMQSQYDQIRSNYINMGIPADQIDKAMPSIDNMLFMIRAVIPSVLLMGGVLVSFINFKVTRIVLKRAGHDIQNVKDFAYWTLPRSFASGMLVIVVLGYIGNYLKIPNIGTVMYNIYSIMMIAFGVTGLSIAYFYLKKRGIKKGLIVILLVIAWISVYYLLSIVGMFDIAFNFRKLSKDNGGGI